MKGQAVSESHKGNLLIKDERKFLSREESRMGYVGTLVMLLAMLWEKCWNMYSNRLVILFTHPIHLAHCAHVQ